MENWREGEKEKPGTSSPSRGWCLWLWPYLCPGSSFFPDKPSMMLTSAGSLKLRLSSLFLQPRLVLCCFCCPSLVLSLSPFQLFGHLCYQCPKLNSLLSNSKNSFCFLDQILIWFDLILQAKWKKYVKMEGVINYAKCCWEVRQDAGQELPIRFKIEVSGDMTRVVSAAWWTRKRSIMFNQGPPLQLW